MSAEVDIKQLAIVRDESVPRKRLGRRHLLSRYVIPGVLMAGFAALLIWTVRDTIWPPHVVSVIPVVATHNKTSQAPLNPCPTPQAQGCG